MRPHDADPLAVFASVAPWDHKAAPSPGAAIWRNVSLDLLLSEPVESRDPVFLPTIMSRLAAVSVGPLLFASQGPRSARLESARIPRVAQDADLDAARSAFWPALPELRRLGVGVGSPAPSLVIVGERDPYEKIPFLSKSGVWLFRALRLLGWDELSVYCTNALDENKHVRGEALRHLERAVGRYEPTWLSVGRVADETLTSLGIRHAHASHPAQHRRFKFRDGPESYATLLREGGLPTGPYLALELPHTDLKEVSWSDPCSALCERFAIARSVAYRPDGKRCEADATRVDPRVAERVRRVFVLGDHKTPRSAARAALGAEATPPMLAAISRTARGEKWEDERAKHLERVREQAKSAAVDAESKATVTARRLAWEATTKSLTKLVKQLDDPETTVRAQDVKAVGDFALALSDRGDITADATREQLGKLSLAELSEKLRAVSDEMFAPPKVETAKEGEKRGDQG